MSLNALKASWPVLSTSRHQLWLLHFLVTIVLSYELLFSQTALLPFGARSVAALGLLALAGGLTLVPSRWWDALWFVSALVLLDTLITTSAIYFSGITDTGLYLTYFLIVLISASIPSLEHALGFALVPTAAYMAILSTDFQWTEGELLRVPILLILATFYGAAAEAGRKLHTQAERILRDSEERFRSVVESAHDGIILTDSWGIILSWNRAAQAMFGYGTEEVVSKPLTILISERHQKVQQRSLEWFQGSASRPLDAAPVELIGRRKDGTEFPLELSLATWSTEAGTFFSGILRDISERKRMEEWLYRKEEQLRHDQKIEAVGRLASQVTHDFNHILFVIMSCVDLLLRRVTQADPSFTKLQEIRKAAERGQALTQQLLTFVRRQPPALAYCDLNAVIVNLLPMLERLLGKNIQIVTNLAEELGQVLADRTQLEQVIVNLATNARDAMPLGGVITIETRNVGPGEVAANGPSSGCATAASVMLVVSDTGLGMDEETRIRCLEPFYTTKPIGQGTGLGLATIHDIVKQAGGGVEIASQPGQGTTVRIYLPRVEPIPSKSAAGPSASSSHGVGGHQSSRAG